MPTKKLKPCDHWIRFTGWFHDERMSAPWAGASMLKRDFKFCPDCGKQLKANRIVEKSWNWNNRRKSK